DVGGRCGVLLDGHAKLVEFAVVLGILGRNALGDGLSAFKLGAGIEEATLLAAVQLEIALGALAVGVEARREDGTAIGTASASDGTDHTRSAGAELIHAARSAGRRFPLSRFIFSVVFLRVAIAAVSVLAIHKSLQPKKLVQICSGAKALNR